MRKNNREKLIPLLFLLVGAILFYLAWWPTLQSIERPKNVLPKPSNELVSLVKDVEISTFNRSDRDRLSAFYTAFSDVVESSEIDIAAKQIRAVNVSAGRRCFGSDLLNGNHSSVAESIDSLLAKGLKDGNLSDVLDAIAWRFSQ